MFCASSLEDGECKNPVLMSEGGGGYRCTAQVDVKRFCFSGLLPQEIKRETFDMRRQVTQSVTEEVL